jgi:PAP2 superfamily
MSTTSIALFQAPAFRFADAPPVVIVAAVAATALAWNRWSGLTWQQPALPALLCAPALCFVIAAIYSTVRPQPVIAEVACYFGLWLVYPVFGTRLTHLANAAGYPLQDEILAGLDAAIGFQWSDWARVISTYSLVVKIQEFAYQSYAWQPALSIIVFAIWGPRGRNRELLTSVLLALIPTVAISIFLPAIGPTDIHGYFTPSGSIVRALRDGSGAQLPYVGIICFPSFHTVMAVLFAVAHRGNRWTFPPFIALNALMLTAIPYTGDHYLTDIIGGTGVAVVALFGARRLLSCCSSPAEAPAVERDPLPGAPETLTADVSAAAS